ncbi:MAG: peptidoglycan DD-metalloendopeptidase family protein [Gammaproteobacteria bacterium]|nr:peptidoglycan DD-metalloendopeptidase family protein [Gammaproteobacteria bacterium]
MIRLVRLLAILVIGAKLAGCSSALSWDPGYHVVETGDTIYSIAFRYDVDQRSLMAWNGIANAALIRVGQRLRLSPPSGSSSAAPPPRSGATTRTTRPPPKPAQPAQSVRWQWPTNGAVIAGYGSNTKTRSGIQIGGKQGQAVRAASGGRIVYAGTALAGYGHLLIIKHNNDYLSAYGHNDRLLVNEGDQVAAGQRIANMGVGPGKRPLLHFEIRLRGEPVNPVGYLPKR